MKRCVPGIWTTLLLTVATMQPLVAGLVQDVTLQQESVTRFYDYYVPDELPGTPVPLLFVLHGGTFDNKFEESTWPNAVFMDIADREKFLVVYPNATNPETGASGPNGRFNWNDCRLDAGPAQTEADDVAFIDALISEMALQFDIDQDRVYATGESNGGMMCYRLAFELSHKIAAIGAVIANHPVDSDCLSNEPENSLAVLIMNGDADTEIMPWNGGLVRRDNLGGEVISALATRDFWIGFLRTDTMPMSQIDFDNVDSTDGSTVHMDLYSNGDECAEVAFVTVHHGGHTMPSKQYQLSDSLEIVWGRQNHDIESPEVIWSFLSEHVLAPNRPPVLDFSVTPLEGEVPLEVTLDASSSSDPENDVFIARWDFGDGSSGSGLLVNHIYNDPGVYEGSVVLDDGVSPPTTGVFQVTVTAIPPKIFVRGDINGDGRHDITDAIIMLYWQLLGGVDPLCLDAADIDDNDHVDLSDSIRLLRYIVFGRPSIPPPLDDCGADPTPGFLDCLESTCE